MVGRPAGPLARPGPRGARDSRAASLSASLRLEVDSLLPHPTCIRAARTRAYRVFIPFPTPLSTSDSAVPSIGATVAVRGDERHADAGLED